MNLGISPIRNHSQSQRRNVNFGAGMINMNPYKLESIANKTFAVGMSAASTGMIRSIKTLIIIGMAVSLFGIMLNGFANEKRNPLRK